MSNATTAVCPIKVKKLVEDKEIMKEATDLLTDLIRIRTENPPGNETPAAKFLYSFLSKEGFEPELLESSESRGNVITSLSGSGGKSLMLLSHLDVVPATPRGWSVDPFSGVVKDGFVWGRGAQDCKDLVAMEALAMALLKRDGFKPKGKLIFAATADEEMGGKAGAGWLVENHLDKVRVEMLINEGGGYAFSIKGRNHYVVQVAEKGVYWMRLRTKGTPGHASMPGIGDNALLKMSSIVDKLGKYRPPINVLDVARNFISTIVGGGLSARLLTTPSLADLLLDRAKKGGKAESEIIRAMLRMTIAPTMIKAGVKENIIPDECEAVVDCRLLPGQASTYLKEQFKNALGSLEGLEMEPITESPGTISPHDTRLFHIIEELSAKTDPNSRCVPFMVPAATDSRYFRQKFGTVAYGFVPMKMDLPLDVFMKLAHGLDERVSQDNLLYGTKFLVNLVREIMG